MPLLVIGGLVILASVFFAPLQILLPALGIYLAIAGYSIEADGRHKRLMILLEKMEPVPVDFDTGEEIP